jgi:hypothetical protein
MKALSRIAAAWVITGSMAVAQIAPPTPDASPALEPAKFVLPTDNHSLLEGKPEDFYQFIDRTDKGVTTQVWEGGQFGFVRNPTTLKTGEQLYARFHEGLDIKPVHRDAKDEPQDVIHAITDGEVVHCSDKPGASNYGRYVVVQHDWGDGPFCSLYAHLSKIDCKVGDKVKAGDAIAIMGHTGVGIDRRRAHVHVELCLFFSSRFSAWHDTQTNTLNYHGMWNGLNLIGVNIAEVFQAKSKDAKVSIAGLVKASPAHFRVAVPGDAELELLEHYPWLGPATLPKDKPHSWEITFTAWGLPIKIEASDTPVSEFKVVWVAPSNLPQSLLTRGLITGTAPKVSITNDGDAFLRLATGLFKVKPRTATPIDSVKSVKPKKK